MGIKSLCAAIAVAIGIGQAADAATVVNIKMKLRYEGTHYSEGAIVFFDADGNGEPEDLVFDTYLANGNPYGIPTLSPHLEIGDETAFKATILVPPKDQYLDYYDNGGRAYSCRIGKIECGYVSSVYMNESLSLGINTSQYSSLSSAFFAGGKFYYTFNLGYTSTQNFDWGWVAFRNRTAVFTLLEDAKIAPVPLPVSAALLPVGIGAFAIMRKRRKGREPILVKMAG